MSAQLAWQHTHELSKEDWRGVAGYIAPQLNPADLILFHEANRRIGFDHYVPKPVCRIAGFPEHGFAAGQTVEPRELPALHDLIRGYQRVWLILASSNDPERLIEQALSANFAQRDHRVYKNLIVMRFDAPSTEQHLAHQK